jgi:trans-aconitate 2-methyltransferase
MWDPTTYLRFSDERSRPFYDLVHRVTAVRPRYVVDLGCGTGELTATLADRWPEAELVGVDNSPQMLDRARPLAGPRLRFELADVRQWQPDRPVDVLVSNAVLHWVPDHLAVLGRLTPLLAPDGWLAFQVPNNFGSPAHVLLYELIDTPPWRIQLAGLPRPQAFDADTYLDVLADRGLAVDAWETTYLHVLSGDDAVLRWMSGTALRPVLSALADSAHEEFLSQYGAALRDAYPARSYGTVLPYRRVFVVAHG